MSKIATKLRLTIGAKLVSLVAVLLITSLTSLIWLSTRMFVEDNTASIQKMNTDTATNLATQTRQLFESVADKTRVLGTLLMQQPNSSPSRDRLVSEFFAKDKDFLGVFLFHFGSAGAAPTLTTQAISQQLLNSPDPKGAKVLTALRRMALVAKGDVLIQSASLSETDPVLLIATPFVKSASEESVFSHALVAIVRQSKFSKGFTELDSVTAFMVDRFGNLLAHADSKRVSAHENVAALEIVRLMLEGKSVAQQKSYFDPTTGQAKLGAYRLVGFGGLGVVAEVEKERALQAAQDVKYRASLIALIVLSIAFFTGYMYSGTITSPIKRLVDAARMISEGNFAINLKPRGRDEVAELSTAFNEMAKGLEERDRVKQTFNKFHNKEIADRLLSGEVKLGGERKEATVFFSDVRGFTALSESMEPEQVVEMLNEYMTRMVSVIRHYGGVVDKYVGDAIMALWGVPISHPDDAINAVRACITMRQDLAKLNQLRISRGQPALKIGMGLNTGPLIAGNIGSNEKMEYTVIGDAVNLASRIESMTKEYGTDLLISRRVHDQVAGKFVFEKCKSSKVKGKAEAIEIFKVRGYMDQFGREVIVETPYSSYHAEKSDKVVHDDAAPTNGVPDAHEAADDTSGLLLPEATITMDLTAPPKRAGLQPPPFKPKKQPPPFRKKAA